MNLILPNAEYKSSYIEAVKELQDDSDYYGSLEIISRDFHP